MLSAVVVGLRTLALLPMHAHRGQAFQGVTPSFHLSNYQLSKQRYFVVCPLTFYRQRTSRTHPEVIAAFSFTLGVGDQDGDELQDVLFRMNIGERIVVHRLLEVDRIEGTHVISGGDQHFSGLNDQGPFRVSDHDGSAFRFRTLHDVGLDKKPGFTGTGAADHQHVFVPCVARILGAAAHRQAFRFREDHVIPGIRINERRNIGVRTP